MARRLDQSIHTLTVPVDRLGIWLERHPGSPLTLVAAIDNDISAARTEGMQEGDIVLRINGQEASEMTIGDAIMMVTDQDDDESRDVTIEWVEARHATMVNQYIRDFRQTNNVSSPHRARNRHAQMSPQRIAAHRARNQHDNLSPEQIVRRRAASTHANMDIEQIERHRERAQLAARLFTDDLDLEYGAVCEHCGFRYLAREHNRRLCCGNGAAFADNFPQMQPLSTTIRRLATSYPAHFSDQSFQYNNVLSFASIGVDNGDPTAPGFVRPERGPHSIKIHGRTYHSIRTAQTFQSGIRYFVYDAADELAQHTERQNLRYAIARDIRQELLEINEYARALRQLGNLNADADLGAEETKGDVADGRRARPQAAAVRLTTQTNSREVAAVIVRSIDDPFENTGTRSIMIHYNDQEEPTYLQGTDPLYDPLAYPLLFPHGELGWGRGTQGVTLQDYLRYRMLMPERGLTMTTQTDQLVDVNRFQLMSRIGQVYLVDTTSRIEDIRLNYIRSHQARFLAQDEADDGVGQDDNQRPRRTFLPSSFHGGKRHLKKLAANALALVSHFGKPTLFITLTCNPRWPEITRELLEGQTAFDRPDITDRVFHAKLEVILRMIRQGDIFGAQHKVEYELRVIEFQFRGLPHAHIVFRLSNMPAENGAAALGAWIDQHITATAPLEPDDDTLAHDVEYYEWVKRHMVHQCRTGQNGCTGERGICNKGFPKMLAEETHFDERGYPVYRRTTPECTTIVPHNRKLLQLWKGHANVEFAGYVFLVLYLYKYIFKGADSARVQMTANDPDAEDEIRLYVKARYMSSMECMWVLLGFQTYPASSPSVCQVVVQLPNQLPQSETEMSDMIRYFMRPPQLQDLRYTELFAQFLIAKQAPAYARAEGYECYQATIKGVNYFYYRRRERIVCRMNTIYITAGEVWYFRLILLHRAVTSHQGARTVNNRTWPTFQEAAKAMGIATDENEAWLCFTTAMADSTPAQLRGLLALLTLEGYPTVRIFRDVECLEQLMADYIHIEPSAALARNRLLTDLADRLQERSKRLSDFGLPEPTRIVTELERERLRYDPAEQQAWIDAQPEPTPDQMAVLDAVVNAFEDNQRLLLFVQGKGGSGKTWLMKRLVAEIRARNGIAQVCAATGLAATLYEHGTTAHGLFKIPVQDDDDNEDEDQQLECKLIDDPVRLELLQATNLFIWDEFPNNNRRDFEAVFRAMNEFQQQIFIACGDFRQIPPVVPNGDKWDVLGASICTSYLWDQFTIMQLTVSHRHADDVQYSQFVQEVGEGRVGTDYTDDDIQNARVVSLDLLRTFRSDVIDEAIDFVYPDLQNAFAMSSRAILAATNDLVDQWNATIQERRSTHPTIIHSLQSADVLTECDDEHGHIRRMLTPEFLHQVNKNGIPPHELKLAVGDICIVMRNLNKKDGLTNNRRVIVLRVSTFAVQVQTIGERAQVFTIPRIRFKFRLPHGSFEMQRTQFPLRLAYCMTYNKSQGQEFSSVLVDLRNPPFTHGHLYVALSRVRRQDDIAAFVGDQADGDEAAQAGPQSINIVYPELLEQRVAPDGRRQRRRRE